MDAVLDADLYVHVNDPVEVVASKLPGGKSVVCGLLNSCDGYNALDVTISGDVNLKNDTGSVTAGVNASLFGKNFSFSIDANEAMVQDKMAERVAERVCDYVPGLGTVCGATLKHLFAALSVTNNAKDQIASSLGGDFAKDPVGTAITSGTAVFNAAVQAFASAGGCAVSSLWGEGALKLPPL